MITSAIPLVLVLISSLVHAIDSPQDQNKLLSFNETVVTQTLRAERASYDWVSTGEDGEYITSQNGNLVIENVASNKSEVWLSSVQIPEDYWEYWIKPDATKVLWAVNYTKQYRYSYFASYLVLDVASGITEPLVDDQIGDIQYATWSPTDDVIAFVRGNDLYVWDAGNVTQVTFDGGPDTFNGVPDWVYEEEILGDRHSLWFSPDGDKLAYLAFNETGVETFTVPYYMDGEDAPPYLRELDLRYPKVGTKNPTVSFNVLDLGTFRATRFPTDVFPVDDFIIGEVAWLASEHAYVAYRAYNRVQDHEKIVLVNAVTLGSTITRERQVEEGWLDNNLAIQFVGAVSSNSTYRNGTEYHVDLSDSSGYNHLYLFSVQAGKAIPLTSGDWEVTDILKVDTARSLIYYRSTEHHSTERHIFSINYQTLEKKPLVDPNEPAVWSASFSSGGGFYLLSYLGPDVPYQELYSINSTKPLRTVTSNAALAEALRGYKLPKISYFELEHPSGVTLNVMQRLPADFNPHKKYPVLSHPYGGPGSQSVSKSFQPLTWEAYIASDPELQYATWIIDNRGTGYKGRAFRGIVTKQLGKLEAEDQVWAVQELLKKNSWADPEKIVQFGWSFGAYLTAKVVELDSGVISLGLITAPVSDWRFYDSMYTERYMKTPELNPGGYEETAVEKVDGFKNIAGGILIQHGTGDDNVHFANSAVLVDTLISGGISPEKMQVQWLTDSDHSIVFHGGNLFLYKQLTKKLYEEKKRVSPSGGHSWSKRAAPLSA
ncbi:putative dipeptidyl peptidase 4 [Eremomyces bilateralis CBS 781.70]|uniref:dipeptidyl-peptidase IV n=1 Tax=Eremomyces bilateralis CBS 781.70 TaxID=1392243 RepID=A0A6G1FRF7_9PEZI|nr:putative dipeptidyl peptidase 4 [Eremomyces bilateralis CBS 781.70]KAF1808300.1 putative dipeptidyl peptidase 4 [Eremomyces bilateralis CBS 781.70]